MILGHPIASEPIASAALVPAAAAPSGFSAYWAIQANQTIGNGSKAMYPRNNATPEPVAIGAVIQISDGAVQTSGVTVRIKPNGVAEADGAGTTAYSTDGIVLYTPTQGETNYTSFILIAKKSACIPVAMTVVTSASAVPGVATLAAATHTGAVIPTVSAVTGLTASNLDATVSSRNAVAPTNLSAAQVRTELTTELGRIDAAISTRSTYAGGAVASVTGAVGSVTGNVGGNVVGSVGSLTGHTVQTGDSFARIGATGSGLTTLASATSLSTVAGYLDTEIAAILADTNELQTDWANGGRLDLLLDSASAGGGLDAAGVRTAIGLASANLDTQLSAIDTVVDSILVDTAEIGVAGAGLTAITATATVDNTAVLEAVAAVSLTLNQIGKQDAY